MAAYPRLEKRSGMSMALVLVLGTLAAFAAFALAALTTVHLNFAQGYVAGQDALYLAESAIARTVDELGRDSNFGKAGQSVSVQPDSSDARRMGRVTFASGDPDCPASVNRFNGMDGNAVLVATGRSGRVVRRLEAVVRVPRFPYAIASAGQLRAGGRFVVRGVNSLAEFEQQARSGGPGGNNPASVAGQSDVSITGRCEVTGDILAGGTVSVPADAIVGGRLRPRTRAVRLPMEGLLAPGFPDFDPSRKMAGTSEVEEASIRAPQIDGPWVRRGNVTVEGNLTLDDGVLYVDGNLVVTGAVQGRGAVVVNGSTTIMNGSDLAAHPGEMVALLSEKDVVLGSSEGSTHFFRGLVFTRGSFTARNITIVGVLVSGARTEIRDGEPQMTADTMTLEDAEVVHVPEAAELRVDMAAAANPASTYLGAGGSDPNGNSNPSDANGGWTASPLDGPFPVAGTMRPLGVTLAPLARGPDGDVVRNPDGSLALDAPAPVLTFRKSLQERLDAAGARFPIPLDPAAYDRQKYPTAKDGLVPTVNVMTCGTGRNRVQFMAEVIIEERPRGFLRVTKGASSTALRACVVGQEGRSSVITAEAEMERRAGLAGTSLKTVRERAYAAQKALAQAFNDLNRSARSSGGVTQLPLDFNVNRFLSDRMPMRVMTWRER